MNILFAMSDMFWASLFAGIVSVLLAIIALVLPFILARINQTSTALAETKATIQENTVAVKAVEKVVIETKEVAKEIVVKAEVTKLETKEHLIVLEKQGNSRLEAQMFLVWQTASVLANKTNNPVHVEAAKAAEQALEEHKKQQAELERIKAGQQK